MAPGRQGHRGRPFYSGDFFVALSDWTDKQFGTRNLECKQDILKYTEYIIIPTEVMCHPFMSLNEKILYGILLGFVSKKTGGVCNPSRKTLAAMMGVSCRTVSKCIRGLTSKYWIYTFRRGGQTRFQFIQMVIRDNIIKVLSKRLAEKTNKARNTKIS
jgi:hypothetical protein